MKRHIKIVNDKKYFFRFTVNQRIQHVILASLVMILVLTGMPLKFHDTFWAPYLYNLVGGITIAPIIHRMAGTVLLCLFVYHVIYMVTVIYKGQIVPLKNKKGLSLVKLVKLLINQPLIPNLKDAKDILSLIKYLFFMTGEHPEGARFTWKEKFDYWAPFWGIAIIGMTGLIMWNEEAASMFLTGEIINYALIAHSDEALLAALFLFIWHWYNVHYSLSVFPMGTVFITGYLSEELMVEEHYEYYVEMMTKEGYKDQILPPLGYDKGESETTKELF
ncbi:MAG: cytochrome b/b6 domain-containing protein [Desulfobacula sp.]|nr:cytochrome b/b6 domain-containing protein [Desulfobacula sp.]